MNVKTLDKSHVICASPPQLARPESALRVVVGGLYEVVPPARTALSSVRLQLLYGSGDLRSASRQKAPPPERSGGVRRN